MSPFVQHASVLAGFAANPLKHSWRPVGCCVVVVVAVAVLVVVVV